MPCHLFSLQASKQLPYCSCRSCNANTIDECKSCTTGSDFGSYSVLGR
ncbi:hypothetical protein BRADI_2g50395v3 [Brachypodium distachyon]|uniref:Uncharacterized protein n=1 Tax=Brachypodium distachyon TaxID=15368 RepID=A0A0Q3JC62_BRADI|nr:hypothetical protein BRADI_2g50395v3 [Brachypodium distachyon]